MKHIARSTLIVAVFFGLEKVLGFVRNVAIARTFGASTELDIFYAANNIPDTLFALISGGALAMALIPVLSEYLQTKGRQAAWDVFSRIGNLVFLVAVGVSILIALFANQLVQVRAGVVPGFEPEYQSLVAELMRLNLIATVLFAMAGMAIAGLQANQHFFLPALGPSMVDLGMIVGIFILVPENGLQVGPITLPALGLGIRGLVYGTILGSALFLLIQIPGLIKYKFRWAPRIDLKHPGVRQVLRVFGPRVVTVFCIQLIFYTQDNLASYLATGSIVALGYGWLFMQFPESLIGTALGTALLPTISEQAASGETEALQNSIKTGIRVILSLTIPLTGIVIAGIEPLIRILGFDPTNTTLVVWTTRAYLTGLVGHSLLEITSRAYYARQNAITPLITKVIALLGFIFAGWGLSKWLGAPGIALANALAFSGETALMLWLLRREFPKLLKLEKTTWRIVPLGLVVTGLVWVGTRALPLDSMGLIPSVLAGGLIMGTGFLITLPVTWPEVKLLLKL